MPNKIIIVFISLVLSATLFIQFQFSNVPSSYNQEFYSKENPDDDEIPIHINYHAFG